MRLPFSRFQSLGLEEGYHRVLRGWSQCTKRVNFPGLQGSQSKSADIINFVVLPNQCAQIRCANCSCKLDKSSEQMRCPAVLLPSRRIRRRFPHTRGDYICSSPQIRLFNTTSAQAIVQFLSCHELPDSSYSSLPLLSSRNLGYFILQALFRSERQKIRVSRFDQAVLYYCDNIIRGRRRPVPSPGTSSVQYRTHTADFQKWSSLMSLITPHSHAG